MSRAAWTQLFLFLHIVGAIAAVGPTLTYGLLLNLGEKAGPGHRAFALESIGWIDNHLATPAFVVQAGTGSALIFLEGWRFFQTAWLLMGVAVYTLVVAMAVLVLAPTVKLQRALAKRVAADPADAAAQSDYGATASRVRALGILITLLTMAILYFMIVKPELWSAG